MDLVNITIGDAAVVGLLGYAVVFVGLIILMFVIMLMSRYFMAKAKRNESERPASAEEAPLPAKAPAAAGSAGELKLYDTDPRDAAMIMAIVADELKTPLNELRFISIREVKEP